MEDNKPIDGAEYISLEDAKRLKLPYFEGLAAGYPSPAGDYQHESLDLNEKSLLCQRQRTCAYCICLSIGKYVSNVPTFRNCATTSLRNNKVVGKV